ncbi:hypothetical protein AAFF_G00435030 [Aldrovandia affinis]|uniref:SH2 domain-containing protein n=1 Tax=Aldrovandia affinis TaxID=143900 RepID=A0AAD7WJ01_9TELE|nr:hypothetical protein AAFF_G00435030 [Aldrovandia affinis]
MERQRPCAEVQLYGEMPLPRSRASQNARSAEVGSSIPVPQSRNRGAISSCPETAFHSTGVHRENHYETPRVMERHARAKKMEQQLSLHGDEEDEYHSVDNQEETHAILIWPARPFTSDPEYADRDFYRSPSPEQSASVSAGSPGTPPTLPKRNIPGPSVNRDLKPGRKKNHKTSGERREVMDAVTQDMQLPPRPSKLLPKELKAPPTGLGSPRARRGAQAGRPLKTESGPQRTAGKSTRPLKGTRHEGSPLQTSFSQDLEFFDSKETRSLGNKAHRLPASDLQREKPRNHEWPQTRGDINTYRHVPKTRPVEPSDTQDWYIGACERVDAEHALHLMNTNGAFLVRDQSKNSTEEPFVISIFHERKVFNIKIRFIKSTRKYALGTGLRTSDVFDSVEAIIKFHAAFPTLSSQKKWDKHSCLTHADDGLNA